MPIDIKDNTPENVREHNKAFNALREKRGELREKIDQAEKRIDTPDEEHALRKFRDMRSKGDWGNRVTLENGKVIDLTAKILTRQDAKSKDDILSVLRLDHELRQTYKELEALREQGKGLVDTTIQVDRMQAIVNPLPNGKAAQEIQDHKDKAEGVAGQQDYATNQAEAQNTQYQREMAAFADQKVVSRADIARDNARAEQLPKEIEKVVTDIRASAASAVGALTQTLSNLVIEQEKLKDKGKEDAVHLTETEGLMKQEGRRVASLGEADIKINGDPEAGIKGIEYAPKDQVQAAVEAVQAEQPLSAFYDTANVSTAEKLAAEKEAKQDIIDKERGRAVAAKEFLYANDIDPKDGMFSAKELGVFRKEENFMKLDLNGDGQVTRDDIVRLYSSSSDRSTANQKDVDGFIKGLGEAGVFLHDDASHAAGQQRYRVKEAKAYISELDKSTEQQFQLDRQGRYLVDQCGRYLMTNKVSEKDNGLDTAEMAAFKDPDNRRKLDVNGDGKLTRSDIDLIFTDKNGKVLKTHADQFIHVMEVAGVKLDAESTNVTKPIGDLPSQTARDPNAKQDPKLER